MIAICAIFANMKEMILHSKGYLLRYEPSHLFSNHSGYVPEHRLIMEKTIGKIINPSIEVVHHADGNVVNNDLSNLLLVSLKEHRRFHSGWQSIKGVWWKTCKGCGRLLPVDGNFYKRQNGHNEYVTRCKECIKQDSRIKGSQERKDKRRTIVCPVCGIRKKTYRYAQTTYCSIKCAWVFRKRKGD